MKKILCVVTSNDVKGATGIPTGFWLSELTHPIEKFASAGISYDLASIKGGKPPIDGDSLDFNDEVNKKFWNDADFQRKLAETIKIDDTNAENYDARDARLLVEREDDFSRAIARGITDFCAMQRPLPDVVDKPTHR